MSIQPPYFIQQNNLTETQIALASEILHCGDRPAFLFSTPDYVLHSNQKLADVKVDSQQSLSNWLRQARLQLQDALQQGNPHALLMGGLPFSSAEDVNLMVMQQAQCYQKILFSTPDYDLSNTFNGSIYLPSTDAFQKSVEGLVHALKNKELDKAVLARILQLDFDQKIDISKLFYNLSKHNPDGYNYAVARNPKQEGWFLGASPELLIAKQQQRIWSKPVAGTAPRSIDPVQDQHNAQQLLSSEKDQYEHALVIEMIADQLSPFCKNLHVPKQPSLIRTKRLWHLATQIEGVLQDEQTHVFDLVEKLHPTPAICGQPTALARTKIADIEPFNRELFAGTMGWADAKGNGEWSVTVRCARVYEQTARLFAGAGIVAASDPSAECAETAAKFRTVLDGFGLSPEQISI